MVKKVGAQAICIAFTKEEQKIYGLARSSGVTSAANHLNSILANDCLFSYAAGVDLVSHMFGQEFQNPVLDDPNFEFVWA